jgi:site-specific recombinase XerD
MFSFLTKKESDNPAVSLSTINMYEKQGLGIAQDQQEQTAILQQQATQSLAAPEMSEVSFDDLQKLFELSNLKAQQLIALLFNGLTLTEISALTEEDFDYDQKTLFVAGESERVVPIPDKVIKLFQNHIPIPAWQIKQVLTEEDLDAILMCAVVDSGISHPDQINSETLRHSYIIYLVRQGLKLSELEPLVGYLSPSKLSGYRSYSPPSRGRDIKEIEILHPALA